MQEIQRQWSNREFLSDDPAQSAEKNAIALGWVKGIQDVILYIDEGDQ